MEISFQVMDAAQFAKLSLDIIAAVEVQHQVISAVRSVVMEGIWASLSAMMETQ